jgi:hypothetical protein
MKIVLKRGSQEINIVRSLTDIQRSKNLGALLPGVSQGKRDSADMRRRRREQGPVAQRGYAIGSQAKATVPELILNDP